MENHWQEKGPWLLKKKWSEAAKAIEPVLYPPHVHRSGKPKEAHPANELQSNLRLIQSALTGTRDLCTAARDFPEVETEAHGVVSRAYAAVDAYLRAAHFQFQERALSAFFLEIQEIYPLYLRELWALKALTQLVLLEQIGRAARGLPSEWIKPDEANRETANATEWVPLCIAALRVVDAAPWKEICEEIGAVSRILREDPCGAYGRMDAGSRSEYLQVVDQLGRFSGAEEPEIARQAVSLARLVKIGRNGNSRFGNVEATWAFFWWAKEETCWKNIFTTGRLFSERVQKAIRAWPEVYYFVGIEVLTFAIIAFLLIGARTPVSLIAALILLSLPVTEAAWGVMNQLTISFLAPKALPKLDFSEGIPRDCSTMVVVHASTQ